MAHVEKKGLELSLTQYAEVALSTNRLKDKPQSLSGLLFGLVGEVGGVLTEVKKPRRELREKLQAGQPTHLLAPEEVVEEMGDTLWYLCAVADNVRVSFNDIGHTAASNLAALTTDFSHHAVGEISFRRIDGLINYLREKLLVEFDAALAELSITVAELLKHYVASQRTDGRQITLETLAKVFTQIAIVCASANVNLAEVAQNNLDKIHSRWPGDTPVPSPLYDNGYSEVEQLPRWFEMEFDEHPAGSKKVVIQRCSNINIGDRLTDNALEPDDYRFHDVFHLSYAAHLGWSPVIRSLFKCKRKSKPEVDENEDGARAAITEEAISLWVFNHAKNFPNHKLYENVEQGDLPWSMLKQIASFTTTLEVRECQFWEWEKAILEGFIVFRQLAKNRRGIVTVDLNKRCISYRLNKDDHPDVPK